jgi:hypothetical protein
MKIPFVVLMHSLVGIGSRDYPLSFGNYCHIGEWNPLRPLESKAYYCVNMWAENINEFKRRNPEIKEVEVEVFEHLCVVVDERIPIEWRSSFCLTGSMGATRESLEKMFALLGKDTSEDICGCEKPDEKPCIGGHGSMRGEFWNRCARCKREWLRK